MHLSTGAFYPFSRDHSGAHDGYQVCATALRDQCPIQITVAILRFEQQVDVTMLATSLQELYRWASVAEAGRRALGLRYQARICTLKISRHCCSHCRGSLPMKSDQRTYIFIMWSANAQLLPYLYSAFHEAHRTGVPVARPLFFADPADPEARQAEAQWLLGDAVLVSPVLHKGDHEVGCCLAKHCLSA